MENSQMLHLQPSLAREIEDASQLQIVFGFEVSTTNILDLFEGVAGQEGFEIIQREESHSTCIKNTKRSFLQLIDCFQLLSEGSMTAIKISVQTREKDSTRICRLRGLLGSKRQIQHMLGTFKVKSAQLAHQKIQQYPPQSEAEPEVSDNPFYLQACATYMFNKILSNERYRIGSVLKNSINGFNNLIQDRDWNTNAFPHHMKCAVAIVHEGVDNLYKDFNYGRKQMERIMPYCRICVEKYVFDRIMDSLFSVYRERAKPQKALFCNKVSAIFTEIGLTKENWLLQTENIGTVLDKVCPREELRNMSKIRKTCEQFQKIAFVTSPREKLKHCQMSFSALKTTVYETSGGKHELMSMQDILPIFILLLLLTELPSLRGQLNIMADFLACDCCDLESQKRLIHNYSQSYNFILNEIKL